MTYNKSFIVCHGISYYIYTHIYYHILWYIYSILMYIAIMPQGSPPSRKDPQLEVAFKVLVSQPKAPAQAMPEDGMKPLGASNTVSISRIVMCFILFHPCRHFESESLDERVLKILIDDFRISSS